MISLKLMDEQVKRSFKRKVSKQQISKAGRTYLQSVLASSKTKSVKPVSYPK